MATRPPQKPSYRPSSGNGNSVPGSSMDMGNAAIAEMARDDTRWFITAVVVLSLVLFLALPLSVLLVIDHMKLKSELKAEIRESRKLRQDLSTQRSGNERSNSNVDQSSQQQAE